MSTLEIKNLHVEVSGKEILKGVNLVVRQGEIHALMGPNGSGKSTLSYAIMGHPKYKITKGEIIFDGKNINDMRTDERARLGIFLSFQYPMEVQGVHIDNFLRLVTLGVNGHSSDPEHIARFRRQLNESTKMLGMESLSGRYLNDGFSGGEKKRSEILQMSMIRPKMAVLDETDSGLDIDALRVVADGINAAAKISPMGILMITHYQRILNFVRPDFVHVIVDGRIVKSGTSELVVRLEEEGYSWAKVAE